MTVHIGSLELGALRQQERHGTRFRGEREHGLRRAWRRRVATDEPDEFAAMGFRHAVETVERHLRQPRKELQQRNAWIVNVVIRPSRRIARDQRPAFVDEIAPSPVIEFREWKWHGCSRQMGSDVRAFHFDPKRPRDDDSILRNDDVLSLRDVVEQELEAAQKIDALHRFHDRRHVREIDVAAKGPSFFFGTAGQRMEKSLERFPDASLDASCFRQIARDGCSGRTDRKVDRPRSPRFCPALRLAGTRAPMYS